MDDVIIISSRALCPQRTYTGFIVTRTLPATYVYGIYRHAHSARTYVYGIYRHAHSARTYVYGIYRHAHSARNVRIRDLSSRALCPQRTYMGFIVTRTLPARTYMGFIVTRTLPARTYMGFIVTRQAME